ncbi:hypothetical protein L596_028297 [Steinernema carpocapsae]|uniref:Uncharacterized protein n=1 Tax=Steinernema carpocapsae TaxID=34508 RepID=A0A4V5ZXU6_STECR|nr:hypothetical protein L596_028297 [Steinernema carpocapsae]
MTFTVRRVSPIKSPIKERDPFTWRMDTEEAAKGSGNRRKNNDIKCIEGKEKMGLERDWSVRLAILGHIHTI